MKQRNRKYIRERSIAYGKLFLPFSLIVFVLLSSLFVNGCKDESISGIKFNHKSHLEIGLPCEMCHIMSKDGKKAGMPTHEECMNCHAINMKKPDKDCLKCHIVKENKVVTPIPPIFEKIQFSHSIHTKAGLDCQACHSKIDNSLVIDGTHYPKMETCIKCHTAKKVTTNCISCHPTWDKDHPPAWHSGNWKKLHGAMSQQENTRCTVCHTQVSCVKCHQMEEPDDHNQFWKKRGHALTVKWERKKCMTCHQTDFCLKCHQNTPPSSHTAGWDKTHCISCHLPKTDTNCIVCHQNPQHSATTNVADVVRDPRLLNLMQSNNCMLCHYGGERAAGVTQHATLPPHPPKFPCTTCHFFNLK